MRAGLLRHRISIEQATEIQDSSGSVVKTWAEFANRYSTYEPQSGKESVTEDHKQSTQSVKFRIRYLSDVTTAMRVVYDGRVFDILSAIDYLGLKTETHLTCQDRVL